jgi:anti-sigma factor ChrR (cupin superfamily)
MSKPVLEAAVLEALLAAVAPAELSQADRDGLHARILARVTPKIRVQQVQPSVAPTGPAPPAAVDPPPSTFTIRAADMRWVSVGPGVEVKVLRMDRERNDQTVLIRMQPGSIVVGHRHTQEEECLILEGEVYIGDYRLGPGDMHVARPGAVHAPIRAPHGALLMIRSEMPPQHFKIA